jgi:hypothetical protein
MLQLESGPVVRARPTGRAKVRLAPTTRAFRSRNGGMVASFDVDRAAWCDLVKRYRSRRQPVEGVRGLIWFAVKAGQS